MYRIEYSTQYSEDFINEVLYLDSIVYPKQFQGDYDSVYDRLLKNQESYILLYDDDNLIGYICLFPVKDVLFNKIIEGKIKEDGFLDSDFVLPYSVNEQHNLYIISIVLHPDYQSKGCIKYLLDGLYGYLIKLNKRGYKVEYLTAVSISKKGKRLLQKIGFQVVSIIDKDTEVLKNSFINTIYELDR